MNDMFNMMGKLSEMKDKMEEVKEKLPFIELTAQSEDEEVSVVITGDKQVKSVHIADNAFNSENKALLEGKVADAMNAAFEKADAAYKEELKNHLGDSMPNIPGLDLNNLPF